MSRFTNVLEVSPLSDGKTWITRAPFGYDVGQEDSKDKINVPIRFMTDFASVPGPFTSFLPHWGKYGNAAVIHDFLYWEQIRDRKKADDIFLEAMEVLGVSWFVRNLMYRMVRWFGGMAWKGNKKRKDRGYSALAEDREIKSIEKAKDVRARGPVFSAK
jgi:hypothetical protein